MKTERLHKKLQEYFRNIDPVQFKSDWEEIEKDSSGYGVSIQHFLECQKTSK